MDEFDETDEINNLCADLVSVRRHEPALRFLFRSVPAGTWVPVHELYAHAGGAGQPILATLVAAWVGSVEPEYTFVLFHEPERQWWMTATYNVARLLATEPAAG